MHLDQILAGLEVSISAFALCDMRGDGRHVLRPGNKTSMHYVVSGKGIGWQSSGQNVDLVPHTVIIVPPSTEIAVTCHRQGNWCDAEPECSPLVGDWFRMKVGDGEPGFSMVCAFLSAQHMQGQGLFDYLHEPLVINLESDQSFRVPFNTLLEEIAKPRPGTKVLTESLLKQCLVSLLRHYMDPNGEFTGPWLAAVKNPAVGKAIAAILDYPENPHTVSGLAEKAGMSRTAFSVQFRQLTGRTPIDLVKEVRLRLAVKILTSTDLSVKAVAARVGFNSRSYFSKSFKAYTGIEPTKYRNEPSPFLPQMLAATPKVSELL